jgi:hypothetical protein
MDLAALMMLPSQKQLGFLSLHAIKHVQINCNIFNDTQQIFQTTAKQTHSFFRIKQGHTPRCVLTLPAT